MPVSSSVVLFLSGDVMTGRGIDQVLPYPCPPEIHESYVRSALDYVALAEEANGLIPRPAPFDSIWGDALGTLERLDPLVRIVNLETSVTCSPDWEEKGINYRMSPRNVACLTVAGLDCCVLSNNHVLDWGVRGLEETLVTLSGSGIGWAGAGRNREEAEAPWKRSLPSGGRMLVFAAGMPSSGVPRHWAAGTSKPGVSYLESLSSAHLHEARDRVLAHKRSGDFVVFSVHWGENWGYEIPSRQREFAHALIEEAGVDLVHGHSSHHAKGIEVHRERLILHGCGDLISDYEGISGYESYRSDLSLMYFPRIDPASGTLLSLEMVPLRMRRFRLEHASSDETRWLRDRLDNEGQKLGTSVDFESGRLTLSWRGARAR